MLKKKILIISPYFFPENFPINLFTKELNKLECEIEVVTSLPNYRNYGFYKNYSLLTGPFKEKIFDCKILRLPVIPRFSNSFFSIFLFYFSFFISAFFFLFFYGIFKRNTFIHVLSFCGSPVFTGYLGKMFAIISKCKSSLWIQDIWPEAILSSFNIQKTNILFKIISNIQELMWNSTDLLIAQSELLEKYLKKNFKNKNIITLNNPSREENDNKNINTDKQSNKVFISYFGNIGKAQNIENFIKNFIKLDQNKYFFNICGDGAELNYLKNTYQSENIHFHGWVEENKLDIIAKNTNYFFLSLKNQGRQKYIIPSKFQTYLSYGKPILFIGDEDICKLIKNNNIGFGISDLNYHSIHKLMTNLYNYDTKLYLKSLSSIDKYYNENYLAKNIAKKFLDSMVKI